MKIWLDDSRKEPDGWKRCYWPDEVVGLLQTEVVEEISLDHDLGNDERGTGYDVLLWLEEQIFLQEIKNIPVIHIHTANPVARFKMNKALKSIRAKQLEISQK